MPAPFEIIAAPFEVYFAPVGEAVPLINVAPAGGWTLIGTNGNKNYSEEGVTVTHEQEIESFRMLGAVGPVKASRVSEGLLIAFTLHDLTLEQYARAIDYNAVTVVAAGAGTAGYKHMGLSRGLTVEDKALLIRGASPYGDGWNMQYEIKKAVQVGSPEVVFTKGAPAGLALEFVVIEDLAATEQLRFGRLVAQHQAPI